ncbi:carbohydrate ABC transporter permease [uncultured Cetobacterium sp.]|uniref:carbohydrate ABC transporter permease n=1 Tax=uncultured Cetobacterium sp. TaxID=527638 RepID=UPI00260F4946|nr:carbohydrate ABC transporter permease [uncultured Cetobacterium sp.]
MNNKKEQLFLHVILILGVIFTLIPFIWMFLTSVKSLGESIQIPPIIFPKEYKWENYRKIIETMPFMQFYYNTIIYTVVRTIGQIIFCSMAAYAFARIEFPFRNSIFMMLLAVLMVPGQIFLLPQYIIIQKLGLLNTISGLVLPGLFSSFGTFLMRQFFMTLPKELEEAAVIDGCNHFQIFYKVMLPLVKPGLVALVIITSLASWNQLMWPLIVNTSTDKMTLSAGLASLAGQHGTDYPLAMAGAILGVLPMLIMFIIFQRKFIEGMASSGIK